MVHRGVVIGESNHSKQQDQQNEKGPEAQVFQWIKQSAVTSPHISEQSRKESSEPTRKVINQGAAELKAQDRKQDQDQCQIGLFGEPVQDFVQTNGSCRDDQEIPRDHHENDHADFSEGDDEFRNEQTF